MALIPSSSIMSDLRKHIGLDEKTYSVMQAWEREFAPSFTYAQLIGIQKGELMLEVLSSVHFQEIFLRRNEIIKKINQYVGKEKVLKGIKIKLKNG